MDSELILFQNHTNIYGNDKYILNVMNKYNVLLTYLVYFI
jgi:hypothetical protein